MTFTFEKALKIIDHYSFLLGKEISGSAPDFLINDIIIAPTTESEQKIFIGLYNQNSNYQQSLNASGFDKESVNVLLIHHDTFGGNVYHYDIDKYLTKVNLEKIYTNPDF